MIWVAWRQQRVVFWLFAIAAALIIGWAVTSGLHEQSLWHQYQGAPCHNGSGFLAKYGNFCRTLGSQVRGTQSHNYLVSDFAQILGLVLGVVLGVRAIASELEQKTARLAWTQSLTRTRWLVTKTSVGLGLIVVLAVPMCVTFSWWVGASRIGPRIQSTAYPLAGWMLGVYPVFLYLLTILFAVLIRRSGWTVAVAVPVFIATLTLMSVEVRSHLVPVHVATTTFQTVTKGDFSTSLPEGGAPANSWIVFSGFIPIDSNSIPRSWANEVRFDDRVNHCENASATNSGTAMNLCLRRLGLRDVQVYVSDHEFWQLQLREGGLYLVTAALLFGASVVVIRRIRV